MRTEMGLLLKDWGLLKSQGKGIIYVLIGGAALMVGALDNPKIDREESAAFLGVYIIVTMAVYFSNMLAYDEMDHGFLYLFSLPVTKKDYVREKYIFCISLDAAVWLLGLVITTVVSLTGSYGNDLKKMLFIITWGMIAGVVLIALIRPVRLKFDGEKGRLMIPVIALLLGGAGMLAGKVCGSLGVNPTEIFQKLDALSEGQLLGGGILFGVICLAISYVCSLRVLEKKEY